MRKQYLLTVAIEVDLDARDDPAEGDEPAPSNLDGVLRDIRANISRSDCVVEISDVFAQEIAASTGGFTKRWDVYR